MSEIQVRTAQADVQPSLVNIPFSVDEVTKDLDKLHRVLECLRLALLGADREKRAISFGYLAEIVAEAQDAAATVGEVMHDVLPDADGEDVQRRVINLAFAESSKAWRQRAQAALDREADRAAEPEWLSAYRTLEPNRQALVARFVQEAHAVQAEQRQFNYIVQFEKMATAYVRSQRRKLGRRSASAELAPRSRRSRKGGAR